MLSRLIPLVYVQLSSRLLSLRNVRSGQAASVAAEIVVHHGPKGRIYTPADEAHVMAGGAAQIVHPFAHPRSLVSDFTAGEQLLKHALGRVHRRGWWATAPRLVLHLPNDPEGGYTEVEVRAFREMGMGAGAFQVAIWQGRSLTDQELLNGTFPADGQLLS